MKRSYVDLAAEFWIFSDPRSADGAAEDHCLARALLLTRAGDADHVRLNLEPR